MKRLLILAAFCSAAFCIDADVQKQKEAAVELKKTLMGALMAKMSSSGSLEAIEFCSQNAMDITSSVAKKYNLSIKRVSEKNRNPQNVPDEIDKKALAEFANQIVQNKQPSEYIIVGGRYYEPIMTNAVCLSCHGKEGDIAKDTAEKIKKLYPNDKAIGYGVKELRGAIVVTTP